jgi:uncharacterized protein (DUF1501 family)
MKHMSHCPGPSPLVPRRAVLATGLGGVLCSSIASWQLRAAAQDANTAKARRGKACILLWMNGGPSHIDTFDPKPGTKTGGEFKAIDTRIKGAQFAEHLPRLADQADKLAVIRSMTTKEGNHDRAGYLMHTGYAPSTTLQHPSLGAWVSHELGNAAAELPNFVSVRGASVGAGFLGVQHGPFSIQKPSEGVRNLPLAKDVDRARFERRLSALAALQDDFRQQTGRQEIAAHDIVYQKAVRLMQSPLAKAFEIKHEPQAVQQSYGDSDFGRGCLMARRLVESGVKFIEVTLDGWDTHVDNFSGVRNLCRDLDPGMSALLGDLAERELLDDTLVICMGEFGRTPAINTASGRDHYPAAWSAVLAGGGTRGGVMHGSTDGEGGKVAANPVTVPDLFATIATLLGIDPTREEMSPVGRPIAISDSGRRIKELINGA